MIKKLVQFLSAGLLTLAVAFPAISAESDTTVIYYHHDVRGDPVVVTTEEGNVLWAEAYRAYGSAEDRVSSAGIGFGDNASENHVSRLGYTGHQSDSGSSLTYMQQRHYDPVIGRFMSNDPVGFTTSNTMMFNRYAYANNNPYRFIDPDGREGKDNNDWDLAGVNPPSNYYNPAAAATVGEGFSATSDAVDDEATDPFTYLSIFTGGWAAKAAARTWTPLKNLFRTSDNVPNSAAPLKSASGNLDDGAKAARTQPYGSFSSIQFGRNANQTRHTFRHVEKYGLDVNDVRAAITRDITQNAGQLQNGLNSRVVYVGDVELTPNVYRFENGAINVGRITTTR